MKTLALGLAMLASALTPPAAPSDPSGIIMGVKYPARGEPSLMIGVLNRSRAYERTATPGQISACTRRPYMAYPACLAHVRTEVRPS